MILDRIFRLDGVNFPIAVMTDMIWRASSREGARHRACVFIPLRRSACLANDKPGVGYDNEQNAQSELLKIHYTIQR